MIRLIPSALVLLGLTASCVMPAQPPTSLEDQVRIARTPRIPKGLAVEARLDDSATILTADVRIRNKTNMPIRLRYDFTWLNASGAQVGTPTIRGKDVTLGAFEERGLRDLAPFPSAVDYRIQLRRP